MSFAQRQVTNFCSRWHFCLHPNWTMCIEPGYVYFLNMTDMYM